MMRRKKDNLKRMDFKVFFIPFLLLFLFFAVITYVSVAGHIEKSSALIERYTLQLAQSYTRRIANANLAGETIRNVVKDRLLITGAVLKQLPDYTDQAALDALALEHRALELTIYDRTGKVINSTKSDSIGWQITATDPVADFIAGNQPLLLERLNSEPAREPGTRYAFVRLADGFVAKISYQAAKIDEFFQKFALERLLEDFLINHDVLNVFFTDNNYQLVASGNEDFAGITFSETQIHEHFLSDEARIGREFIDQESNLHVCAPVVYNGEKIGTLTVVWAPGVVDSEITAIIRNNIFRFALLSVLLAGVLYYAYLKNRTNISIAFYDALTGLPNSFYFDKYLNWTIDGHSQTKPVLLLFDCANFNLINLTYGFDYGDQIINEIAQCLAANRSDKDMLFRLIGDRFALLITGENNPAAAKERALKIMDDFKSEAFLMHKHEYLELMISIYQVEDKDDDPSSILQNAVLGIEFLYDHQQTNCILVDEEIKSARNRNKLIEQTLIELINGTAGEAFTLKYQPIYRADSGEIFGFEALGRLDVPGLGQIPALEFIELAEKRNLMFSLGNIVLEQAISFAELLAAKGYANKRVFVNISGQQLLRGEFVRIVQIKMLPENKARSPLVFEITESTLLQNFILINEKLAILKQDMGIEVALDDFGVTYSSLNELRNLNVDYIKVDRSFVEKIGYCDESALISQDIINMAHRLALQVIGEGVETHRQKEYLTKYNCDFLQGFYLNEPLTKENVFICLDSQDRPKRLSY